MLERDYRSLWGSIFEQLRISIVVGDLPPGTRLVEASLAEQFGVSRGPVRTALAELERVGLAQSSPRRGTTVVELRDEDIREIFILRHALELLALTEASSRIERGAIDAMAKVLDRLDEAVERGDLLESMEADLQFHRSICIASANSRLLRAWDELSDQLRLVIASVQRTDASIASDRGLHRRVLVALSRGDVEGARDALGRHIEDSQKVMGRVPFSSTSSG